MKMSNTEILTKEIESRYIGATVRIMPVEKNNTTLTGVTIQLPNRKVSPCIYLESLENIESLSAKEIADRVVEINANALAQGQQLENITDTITNFDNVKDSLRVRIVPHKGNDSFLSQVVHEQFLDMEIIPYVVVEETEDGCSSVKVTQQLCDMWKKTSNEVITIARENTHNFNCTSMQEIMKQMFLDMSEFEREMNGITEEMIESMSNDNSMPMYVITNSSKLNGAAAISNERYMQNVSNDLGDLLVLPSSVHEVIVVPLTDDMDINYMTQMVQEVNGSQVPPEDRLSDHAYIFRKETGWEF